MNRFTQLIFASLCAIAFTSCADTPLPPKNELKERAQGSIENLKPHLKTKEDIQKAFVWACKLKNMEQIHYLLKQDADVNYIDKDGYWSPIIGAIEGKHLSVVELLVQKGTKVDQEVIYGWTPLLTAAWYNSNDIVRFLVREGADLYKANQAGENTITLLQKRGQKAFIDELLQIHHQIKAQLELEKQKEQIALYLKEQNFEGLKVYVERYPNTANLIPQAELRLALTGPKDLKVGDIRKLVQKGMDEKIILSLVKRVKVPYKEFTLDEIDLIIEMGISSNIIATMIDVTTELLKDQERKKEQEFFLKEQTKMAKQGQQTTQVNYKQAPSKGKDVVDVVTEEAAKQGVKMLLDHLF
jgi:hypothetical protein